MQFVKISNNLFSQASPVLSGVIQGSILGPILYAVYTNYIVRCFSYGKPVLYAYDLKGVFPINLSSINNSYKLIMRDLNNL